MAVKEIKGKNTSHKFFLGDNVRILKDFVGDDTVDLTVTSPPYDDLRTYNGFDWNLDGVIEQLWRVTKDGGVVVWVVGDKTYKGSETGTSFRTALKFMEYGWRLHDTMIYAKTNPVPLTHNRYEQQFEYMFVFSKGKPKTFSPIMEETVNPGGRLTITQRGKDGTKVNGSGYGGVRNKMRYKRNIWSYNVGKNQTTSDDIAFNHPAIFPEKLAYDHIISWSNESDVVLDLFGGSGTVAKMAEKAGRNSVYIDISEEYLQIASERLGEFLTDVNIK